MHGQLSALPSDGWVERGTEVKLVAEVDGDVTPLGRYAVVFWDVTRESGVFACQNTRYCTTTISTDTVDATRKRVTARVVSVTGNQRQPPATESPVLTVEWRDSTAVCWERRSRTRCESRSAFWILLGMAVLIMGLWAYLKHVWNKRG